MTNFVTSQDGTRIAHDRLGEGPPVVVVGGIFCARPATQALAEQLAQQFTVINYDRRGRGESGHNPAYAVEREVEDIAALIAELGGAAAVYGHSSGAGLALHAAASGLPITRLILHEPPYGPDDEASRQTARELAENVRSAIADDRRADAIRSFFADMDMPAEVVDMMTADPDVLAVAPTMPHDFAVMGDASRGGTIPEALVRAIGIPTLVIAGGASPAFFRDTAERLVKLLPDGQHVLLEGQDHAAAPDVVASAVAAFLTSS